MANNLIQIRRSNTSATPGTTLYSGELAYSYSGNNLFIGAQTGIGVAATKIAGAKFGFVDNSTAGSLTANAAVIVDSNAFISNTYTAGLFVASSIASPVANATAALITSITPQANATQLGATAGGSNTELVTSFAIKTYVDGKVGTTFSNGVAYTWSAVQTFNANVNLSGNATSQLIVGTAADGVDVTSNTISVGNATIFTTVNSTAFSGTANNATNFGGSSLATIQGQITGNAATAYTNAVAVAAADATTKAGTAYTNAIAVAAADATTKAGTAYTNAIAVAATDATTKAGTAYTNAIAIAANATNLTSGTVPFARLPANVVFWSNANIFTANQSFNLAVITGGNSTSYFAAGTGAANGVVNATAVALTVNSTASAFINSTAFSVTNGSVTTTATVANVTSPAIVIGGQISANATIANFGTVANIIATSAQLDVRDIVATGNLTVSGTVTYINTTNLELKDNIILLADTNANVVSDSVDFGIVGQANSGVGGTNSYYGLVRVASANTFQLFSTNTIPGATTIAGQTTMPLQAFLRPFGTGTAFVVNSTAVSAVANASVSVNITANTVTITSGLAATSGGTGRTTGFTAGDILFASNTTYMSNLAIGANGYVLQVTNNLPSWNTLDGGTF
jgi:hypothetical protein